MGEPTRIASVTDLSPGQAKCYEVAGKRIALFNVGGTFYAVDDTCPHRGGPLSEGEIEGKEITCPWHGATFDLVTGNHIAGPAPRPISCYRVSVQGGEVCVEA